MLKRLKTNPIKSLNYKLVLIVLFFLALVTAVIIYYNKRIKGIEHDLKQPSLLNNGVMGAGILTAAGLKILLKI